VRPSANVKVEPTEAVPLCVNVPLAIGGEPIAAVADENAAVAVMEFVAVTRTRMCVAACAVRSLKVLRVAPVMAVQESVEESLVQANH
jgi:hypothetical protein